MQMRQRKVKQQKIRHQLSQADLNILLKILSPASSKLQESIHYLKTAEKIAYQQADKDTEEGREYFRMLNQIRDTIGFQKQMNKKVASIIYKLKSQR